MIKSEALQKGIDCGEYQVFEVPVQMVLVRNQVLHRCPHCGDAFEGTLFVARGFIGCMKCMQKFGYMYGRSLVEKLLRSQTARVFKDGAWAPVGEALIQALLAKLRF